MTVQGGRRRNGGRGGLSYEGRRLGETFPAGCSLSCFGVYSYKFGGGSSHPGERTEGIGLRSATLVSLFATAVAGSPVQVLGDELADCASVTRSNLQSSPVTVICAMPHERLVELVKIAASPAAGNRAALLVRLNAIVPANSRFPVEAVARFLEILHEQPIDDDRLADSFARIVQEHERLLQEIRTVRVTDPEVRMLYEAAAAALQGAPNHDLARAKLEEARNLVRAKRQAGAKVPADQQREEAGLVREQAKVETARLRFAEAARLYEQAAKLLPAEDRDERASDWVSAGRSWMDQGRDFGDNPALLSAIAAYRAALEERTRARAPLDWATTQNNLGNALLVLGDRESGTARLEEAVAAYRAALEERTRERVPLDWATTQNNLGIALWTLGERESGTARLEEAVAAYRAALEERTRERVPLDWATTQNNLGNALQASGSARAARRGWRRRLPPIVPPWRNGPARGCRSTGRQRRTISATRSGHLGSARAARRGWRKRLPPIGPPWRNGPASGCRSTGPRRRTTSATRSGHSGSARAARRGWRRRSPPIAPPWRNGPATRVPLDWAATQNNLGSALLTLGERESGTARLEEAVAAYRVALEERTRERVPLDWATTQHNLGVALWTLARARKQHGAGWRRRLPPIVPPWRNEPARACRSTGPRRSTTSASRSRYSGERESGTARLEEAVAAWDLCLTVAESAWRPQSVQDLLRRRAEVKAEIKRRASR